MGDTMNAALPQQVPATYQNLTLSEAESYIEGNLITTARAYVATGYFLKRIRNDHLYEEDGYKNFDEYVRAKYGKGKDWASRCIKVNDQLSVDGDSPYLGEEYKGYTTYQLVELAYMTEEQREQATPEQTVKELREIRRPKEVSYFPIEGQLDFETDFPEIIPEPVPEEKPAPQVFEMSVEDMTGDDPEGGRGVAISQQPASAAETQQNEPECCGNRSEEDGTETELSAYGTRKKIYPEGSLIASEACEGGHCCFSCAMECEIRGEDRYCREALMGNPFPCETLKWGLQNQQNEIGDRCQFVNHDLADHCAGSGEADPCCKNCADPCEYICARAMKKLDEQQKTEDAAAEEKEPDERWNIGELPQARDQHLRKLAEILAEAKGIQMVVNRSDSYLSEDTIKSNLEALAEQNSGSIDIGGGAEAWPSQEMIEFCAGGEDLGVCSYVRFANHVRKVMETWTPGTGSKPEENVIDAEFTEITDPSSDELKPVRAVLQKESAELDAWLKAFEGEPSERIPPEIEHKKIIVAALAALVCDLEETELLKQQQWPRAEQPDLPTMRNNDQRKEFLDTFHDWPVWFRVPEASEVYYRYDLPDRTALVICEYRYYAAWMEEYKNRYSDMNPEQTETREYLLTPGYHYLHDCQTNRSAMIDKLKEIQKKG